MSRLVFGFKLWWIYYNHFEAPILANKDMSKEKYFVLDLLAFIFHRSTDNQTSWRELACTVCDAFDMKNWNSIQTKIALWGSCKMVDLGFGNGNEMVGPWV